MTVNDKLIEREVESILAVFYGRGLVRGFAWGWMLGLMVGTLMWWAMQ